MVETASLSWVLTALFALVGGWSLFRCADGCSGGAPRRAAAAGHLVMSALMIPMAWSWGMALPIAPQVVALLGVTGWFLLAAIALPAARVEQLHHAAMGAAMVWMLAAMPMFMRAPGAPGSGGHQHHASGGGGPLRAAATPGPAAEVGSSALATAVIGGGFFVVMAAVLLAGALDRGRRLPPGAGMSARGRCAWDSACHAASSLGMGVMLWAMP